MRKLGWRQWVLLATFLVALLFTVLFGVRTVRRAVYWRNHRDEPIRAWMNVHYVAHSYRVPPHVLDRAIGLPPGPPDRRPLRDIALAQNRPVEALISELQEAIVHSRPPYPPPPPPDEGPPNGSTPPR
ncbi:MAG: hypothetical protein QOH51_522 [Acidobacteriota bacterium]|jgi:hypothetical protein|nr:hypothetical protein [Acidobacteriota bacterium]